MPSDKPARRLLDIIENGEAIAQYTEGMDGTAFDENTLVSDAWSAVLNASAKP